MSRAVPSLLLFFAVACREPAAGTSPPDATSTTTADASTGTGASSGTSSGPADGTGDGSGSDTTAAPLPDIDVQAHRGDRAQFPPGNTIFAFESALQLGVDTLEGDMQITADGAIVMGHDDDLLVTGCTLVGDPTIPSKIREMTIDEVAQWDCHPEIDGVQSPPPVQDVFDLDPDVGFNFELKRMTEADADVYLPVLAAYDTGCGGCLAGRLTIQCFAWPTLQYVRATYHVEAGGSLTFFVSALSVDAGAGVVAGLSGFADIVSPSSSAVDPELVTAAHDAGMRVVPWTVNDPDEMRQQIELGVDGIITDDPAALLELLGR